MARDNSPKKRQKKQLERKQNRRASYDRILIVSEGSQTEPNYFKEIRATYRLNTANVAITPSKAGTAPIQVVQYAETLFSQGDYSRNIQRRAFEKVYAVFDRDDHDSYDNALTLAASLDGKLRNDAKQPIHFQAITSIPCFELWLLLHYENIKAPLHRDEAVQRLRTYVPDYLKGAKDTFKLTREYLSTATQRAELLAKARTEPEDPFTNIADLVKLLTTP